MPKIYVCTVYKYLTYQMLLNRKWLTPHVDGFFELGPVVFGRGRGYDNTENESNQAHYRSKVIEQVPDGDYFLVVDADELILGDYSDMRRAINDKGWNIYTIRELVNSGHLYSERRPRLIKKTKGMRYIRHELLIDDSGQLYELWHGKYPLLSMYLYNMQEQIKLEEIGQWRMEPQIIQKIGRAEMTRFSPPQE